MEIMIDAVFKNLEGMDLLQEIDKMKMLIEVFVPSSIRLRVSNTFVEIDVYGRPFVNISGKWKDETHEMPVNVVLSSKENTITGKFNWCPYAELGGLNYKKFAEDLNNIKNML